ncbi:MAG: TetR/AcrR family transcriptional regulator [Deltaproteobacteria bacterium]|nr:TetR/AcrR family transcriptional regulator [Deltaproteobacteria bacterium]MBW2387307.1 TetR/AcrR family transcriptional regulator [Deltaproteobacteria bacterium]MBW2723972.1 TetR/AcrR family transcriptional regulator [Deltaproteobacteria bacterium]
MTTTVAPPDAAATPPGKNRRSSNSGSRVPLRADDGRLVRGRKSRARIREAALSLFREKGFDGATLRAIAARAGMGASSIYRHVKSKEELLIEELADLQEDAWTQFRKTDDRSHSTHKRVSHFLDVQHEMLTRDRDLSLIALRSTTRPEAAVARRVLTLYDRTIGLLAEILQMGRKNKDLRSDVKVLEAAQALFHVTLGARIAWSNGLVSAEGCRKSIQNGVNILFKGLEPQ